MKESEVPVKGRVRGRVRARVPVMKESEMPTAHVTSPPMTQPMTAILGVLEAKTRACGVRGRV